MNGCVLTDVRDDESLSALLTELHGEHTHIMQILQSRYNYGEDFTLSRLFINGELSPQCPYILEDKVREIVGMPTSYWKIKGETAIPVGTYEVVIDMSERWHKLMMHLLNVPGFDGIRVHAGDTSHDTEGCLLCGKERDEKNGEVSGSRIARDALFLRINGALKLGEKVFWTVNGLP